MPTRVRLAVFREQTRIKRASPEAEATTSAAFASGPDPNKAVAIVGLGVERGQISPQEGAELAVFATTYDEVGLAERIVLVQALLELTGRPHSRHPILD